MTLSILILSRDKPQFILPLLDSLLPLGHEVIVGDTGSTDPAVLDGYRARAGRFTLVEGMAYHFSAANNALARRAGGGTLLFLNNDIIFGDAGQSLAALSQALEAAAIVGPRLAYPDASLQHGGIALARSGESAGLPHHIGHGGRIPPWPAGAALPVAAVTGAALMIRAGDFRRLGGFDEAYARECQDVALCLAARRIGLKVAVVEAGPITHVENGTRQKGEADSADRARLLRHFGTAARAGIV